MGGGGPVKLSVVDTGRLSGLKYSLPALTSC